MNQFIYNYTWGYMIESVTDHIDHILFLSSVTVVGVDGWFG